MRQLAWFGVIAGVLLVVGGAIERVTGFGPSSAHHQGQTLVEESSISTTQHRQRFYGTINLGIAYGTRPKQVLGELGSPSARRAECWVYRGSAGRVRGRYSGTDIDAINFCFSEAPAGGGKVVSQIFIHVPAHTIIKRDPVTHAIISKKHFRAQWVPTVTFMKVPDWYLQENS